MIQYEEMLKRKIQILHAKMMKNIMRGGHVDDKHVLEPKYVNPVMKQVTGSGALELCSAMNLQE